MERRGQNAGAQIPDFPLISLYNSDNNSSLPHAIIVPSDRMSGTFWYLV